MKAAQLLQEAAAILEAAGVDSPRTDARLLLQHALGISHAAMISAAGDEVPPAAESVFRGLLARRAAREPVSRIIGHREFRGLRFAIGPAVLDPRPETELLVEVALAAAPRGAFRFADVGTGSGAIAIAILAERADAHGIAVDISAGALAFAAANAAANGVAARLACLEGDLLEGVPEGLDFVVSNPPYIASDEIGRLEPEVCGHDPIAALDGGSDGLDFYRRLLGQTQRKLVSGGLLHLELGAGQAAAVGDLALAAGWVPQGVHHDLGGVARVASFRRAG